MRLDRRLPGIVGFCPAAIAKPIPGAHFSLSGVQTCLRASVGSTDASERSFRRSMLFCTSVTLDSSTATGEGSAPSLGPGAPAPESRGVRSFQTTPHPPASSVSTRLSRSMRGRVPPPDPQALAETARERPTPPERTSAALWLALIPRRSPSTPTAAKHTVGPWSPSGGSPWASRITSSGL
jgi:hypothetical protein